MQILGAALAAILAAVLYGAVVAYVWALVFGAVAVSVALLLVATFALRHRRMRLPYLSPVFMALPAGSAFVATLALTRRLLGDPEAPHIVRALLPGLFSLPVVIVALALLAASAIRGATRQAGDGAGAFLRSATTRTFASLLRGIAAVSYTAFVAFVGGPIALAVSSQGGFRVGDALILTVLALGPAAIVGIGATFLATRLDRRPPQSDTAPGDARG
jgi:MFS family permease